MSRERQHDPGKDAAAAARAPAPAARRPVTGWPGKQAATTELAGGAAEPDAADAAPDAVDAFAGLDALDRHVGELQREPPPVDEPALWAAQQQRGARRRQLLAWAAAHRAR